MANVTERIIAVDVKDIRFPTSIGAHGSDAMHTDPDYSCAYVVVKISDRSEEGYGLTFTLGRGTEVVVSAINSLIPLMLGVRVGDIFSDFRTFWRKLTSDTQMRWIGPEKGVMHLAVAAIVNALWDLWARLENKPLWRLLVDLTPEELVSTIDFRYITDVITPTEAIELLKAAKIGQEERLEKIQKKGYPAYTTQIGWLGYSDVYMKEMATKFLNLGYTSFKLKVGQNLDDDIRRCQIARDLIGWENNLMIDANQVWDVPEAIAWVQKLAHFKPLWIEEPTSPDDVLGHATISSALRPLGIGVATGEMCCNRVLFKQFLHSGAMQFCQIDSARIGGVNEILSVYLMAMKLGIPVCPHAGGVGLCEMVQHLQIWDYVSVSKTMDNRIIEFVDQQHEHFEHPTNVVNAHYIAPITAGYSTKLKADCILKYEFPNGSEWKEMTAKGYFQKSK